MSLVTIPMKTKPTIRPQSVGETMGGDYTVSFGADDLDRGDREGYTREQFMSALKAVSAPMARRALAAKEEGMLGAEESERLLNDILDARD